MRPNMKKLLEELIKIDATSEELCAIFRSVRSAQRAYNDFQKSETSESEASARWKMRDAREEWMMTRAEVSAQDTNYDVFTLIDA